MHPSLPALGRLFWPLGVRQPAENAEFSGDGQPGEACFPLSWDLGPWSSWFDFFTPQCLGGSGDEIRVRSSGWRQKKEDGKIVYLKWTSGIRCLQWELTCVIQRGGGVGSAFVGGMRGVGEGVSWLGGLLSLSLGSWNKGVGETGRRPNVRTIPTPLSR